MALDTETGEIKACADCPFVRERVEAEQDLRAAERELRRLRRRNSALETELRQRLELSPENATAKALGRYWIARCGRDPKRTKLGEKRMKAVIARLRDGYEPAYIARAIDGLAEFAYVNPMTKQPYDDLELVCRNEVNLERFYNQADKGVVKTLINPQWIREVGGVNASNG